MNITLLWPDAPGQIIGSGDIDNKLKTLLDALSCPSNDNQLNNITPDADEKPFFCVLEDDKLIQKINIQTHTLLENTASGEIFVLIHIQSKIASTMWGNIGL